MQKRKHELCLLIKEDWFGTEQIKELQEAIKDYQKLNPAYTSGDILTIAEQIVIESGATLVPYNSMTLPY